MLKILISEDEVAKETMPPGCSEHSTGLAFSLCWERSGRIYYEKGNYFGGIFEKSVI